MINADKLVTDNLVSISGDMKSVWQGSASTELCSSLDSLTDDMNTAKDQIATYNTALSLLEIYKEKVSQIKDYEALIAYEEANPSLKTTEEYVENGKTFSRTVYVVNQALIDSYKACIEQLEKEKEEVKSEIQGILSLLTGIDVEIPSMGGPVIPENELSYEDALELANKLCVPVDYILSLHLHEGYQLGDRLIPEGINPDVIHYAGPNGYPILIDGIKDMGDEYWVHATERGVKFYKKADNFAAVGGGREYNIQGWPIAFDELEINYNYNGKEGDVYWTWYGPKSQGNILGQEVGAIQCTTEFYPCDDGFYRDKDGYIVLASNPYVNQYDKVTGEIDFSKNGGLDYEQTFILTPFGLGKMYDNTEKTVPNGISADLYRNDGLESNTIAQTDAGKRLRESAVADYESLNLYWGDMIH